MCVAISEEDFNQYLQLLEEKEDRLDLLEAKQAKSTNKNDSWEETKKDLGIDL